MFKKTPNHPQKFSPDMMERIRSHSGLSPESAPLTRSEAQTRINRLEALAPEAQQAIEHEKRTLRTIGWTSLAGAAAGVGAIAGGVANGYPIVAAIGLGVGAGSGIVSYKSFRAEQQLSLTATLAGLRSTLESLPPQQLGGSQ